MVFQIEREERKEGCRKHFVVLTIQPVRGKYFVEKKKRKKKITTAEKCRLENYSLDAFQREYRASKKSNACLLPPLIYSQWKTEEQEFFFLKIIAFARRVCCEEEIIVPLCELNGSVPLAPCGATPVLRSSSPQNVRTYA